MATPLSPAPRFTAPLRPRYRTNPSQDVPYNRQSNSREVARRESKDSGRAKQMNQSTPNPLRTVHAPILPIETTDMNVDLPTPSPAITSDMSEFPLPPTRSVPLSNTQASSDGQAPVKVRPLPPRPGPPPVSTPLLLLWPAKPVSYSSPNLSLNGNRTSKRISLPTLPSTLESRHILASRRHHHGFEVKSWRGNRVLRGSTKGM